MKNPFGPIIAESHVPAPPSHEKTQSRLASLRRCRTHDPDVAFLIDIVDRSAETLAAYRRTIDKWRRSVQDTLALVTDDDMPYQINDDELLMVADVVEGHLTRLTALHAEMRKELAEESTTVLRQTAEIERSQAEKERLTGEVRQLRRRVAMLEEIRRLREQLDRARAKVRKAAEK